jgi:hypothetical protein
MNGNNSAFRRCASLFACFVSDIAVSIANVPNIFYIVCRMTNLVLYVAVKCNSYFIRSSFRSKLSSTGNCLSFVEFFMLHLYVCWGRYVGLRRTRQQGLGVLWCHQIWFGWSDQELWDERGMWHEWRERKGVCRILVGKHERTRVLARPRSKWEKNIKIALQNLEWGWTGLAWLRIGTYGAFLCTW